MPLVAKNVTIISLSLGIKYHTSTVKIFLFQSLLPKTNVNNSSPTLTVNNFSYIFKLSNCKCKFNLHMFPFSRSFLILTQSGCSSRLVKVEEILFNFAIMTPSHVLLLAQIETNIWPNRTQHYHFFYIARIARDH